MIRLEPKTHLLYVSCSANSAYRVIRQRLTEANYESIYMGQMPFFAFSHQSCCWFFSASLFVRNLLENKGASPTSCVRNPLDIKALQRDTRVFPVLCFGLWACPIVQTAGNTRHRQAMTATTQLRPLVCCFLLLSVVLACSVRKMLETGVCQNSFIIP